MRQPADRHTVRNARANTSHPPAPRPHASSRDAQVATLCAPQRCTGRPGGVPGAPAAKHVTRQRHEPAALCGTNSKGDENWRDLFQREDQAGALSLQPTQVQRHGAAAPPGPRRARGPDAQDPAQIAVLFHGKLLQQGCVPADRPQRRAQRSRPRIGRRRANSAPCSQDAAGAGNGMNVSLLVFAPLFFFNVFVF